jgi:hypothetical protein
MEGAELAAAGSASSMWRWSSAAASGTYPFGIAMVSLYFFVFAEARLYRDALLQIFFLGIQLYGWWNWRAHMAADSGVAVADGLAGAGDLDRRRGGGEHALGPLHGPLHRRGDAGRRRLHRWP